MNLNSHSLLTILKLRSSYGGPAVKRMMPGSEKCFGGMGIVLCDGRD